MATPFRLFVPPADNLSEASERSYEVFLAGEERAVREQDRRFVGALAEAFERGEFPGQPVPVLVLRG